MSSPHMTELLVGEGKMTEPAVEIRRNDDGSVDEVVASNCQSVHIEQMRDCGWYLEIVGSDGGLWQFWLGAKNGRSHVELRLTDAATADVIP